jgi:hypothetical protein
MGLEGELKPSGHLTVRLTIEPSCPVKDSFVFPSSLVFATTFLPLRRLASATGFASSPRITMLT